MEEMTSAELNQYLENIAKLIEANVKYGPGKLCSLFSEMTCYYCGLE